MSKLGLIFIPSHSTSEGEANSRWGDWVAHPVGTSVSQPQSSVPLCSPPRFPTTQSQISLAEIKMH